MESAIAGRRRTTARHSAEDQALDQIAKEVWLDYFMRVARDDICQKKKTKKKPMSRILNFLYLTNNGISKCCYKCCLTFSKMCACL